MNTNSNRMLRVHYQPRIPFFKLDAPPHQSYCRVVSPWRLKTLDQKLSHGRCNIKKGQLRAVDNTNTSQLATGQQQHRIVLADQLPTLIYKPIRQNTPREVRLGRLLNCKTFDKEMRVADILSETPSPIAATSAPSAFREQITPTKKVISPVRATCTCKPARLINIIAMSEGQPHQSLRLYLSKGAINSVNMTLRLISRHTGWPLDQLHSTDGQKIENPSDITSDQTTFIASSSQELSTSTLVNQSLRLPEIRPVRAYTNRTKRQQKELPHPHTLRTSSASTQLYDDSVVTDDTDDDNTVRSYTPFSDELQ